MPDDEKVNTRYTREIVCPYCGHVETDSWEIAASGEDGDVGTHECKGCNQSYTYKYSINVEVIYCTSKRRK